MVSALMEAGIYNVYFYKKCNSFLEMIQTTRERPLECRENCPNSCRRIAGLTLVGRPTDNATVALSYLSFFLTVHRLLRTRSLP